MRTVSRVNIELVEELAACIEQRRMIEKREKDIKIQIRNSMGGHATLEAGHYVVIVTKRLRNDLDTLALKNYLGEKIAVFYKVSEYEIMQVSPIRDTIIAAKVT